MKNLELIVAVFFKSDKKERDNKTDAKLNTFVSICPSLIYLNPVYAIKPGYDSYKYIL